MVLLRHISVAFTAAVTAVGAALFVALNLFYKRRVWTPEDYYVFREEEEEHRERQVLVLGLDGAGKSSVLQGLSGEAGRRPCRPTRGFNFIRLHTPACQLDFLEIGGGEELRVYWPEFLRKTHALVYVVDSSDRSRLPLAKDELHRLLRVDTQLPVVILGNKQDKPNAAGVRELREALCLGSVAEQRKLLLLALQPGSTANAGSCSTQNLRDILLKLV
ncbi:ADP-ribosylation factor-like 10 [Brachyhypopomus gauderio]|uniref:ADP-ribosylation factor-like 10 n=1 Tax=Brachyhypopomus gauderio TaxID=698409 RepID=UPI0040439333